MCSGDELAWRRKRGNIGNGGEKRQEIPDSFMPREGRRGERKAYR